MCRGARFGGCGAGGGSGADTVRWLCCAGMSAAPAAGSIGVLWMWADMQNRLLAALAASCSKLVFPAWIGLVPCDRSTRLPSPLLVPHCCCCAGECLKHPGDSESLGLLHGLCGGSRRLYPLWAHPETQL